MKNICTICARGGSKGVPNKNVRLLAGKPLIAHSIEQARQSGLFERIVVSSDSQAILDIAASSGADLCLRRPDELARDDSPKIPVIQHAFREAEKKFAMQFEIVVDLDATSPLRNTGDIHSAVKLLKDSGAPNVITGMKARRSPYFNLVESDNEGRVRLAKVPAAPITRRQDAPACYDMNASIYVWRREALLNATQLFHPETRIYVMPEERSIDIDSEMDFKIVEHLIKEKL